MRTAVPSVVVTVNVPISPLKSEAVTMLRGTEARMAKTMQPTSKPVRELIV
ncbi:MAG: hypothetical protein ABR986_09270 [Methanomassiliicoccales archaeon]